MDYDNGPTPKKRLKVWLCSSDSDESDELNLSPTFNETYQTLMNDEIREICLKRRDYTDDIRCQNNFSEFIKKFEEILVWIETVCSQTQRSSLCRSDFYLTKIHQRKYILQSSRLENIKMLGQMVIFVEPSLYTKVAEKIKSLENQCDFHADFTQSTLPHVLHEINADVDDLFMWLNGMAEKLNFDIAPSNKTTNDDNIEFILRDFEIHNEISLSVIRLTNELQDITSFSLLNDSINDVKSAMDSAESYLYQLWLKAIEFKLIFEERTKEPHIKLCPQLVRFIGHESGFESEISPMNDITKISNSVVTIKDICSGSNITDHSADLYSESKSAVIYIDKTKLSTSTLYSSTESLNLSLYMEDFVKETLQYSKRIIRRRKRRSRKQVNVCQYGFSTEESETCENTASKSLHKRRIEEVSHSQMSDVPQCSQILNYAEIADIADKLVRNTFGCKENLAYKSVKGSELEDTVETSKSSINDIDLDKAWDYYQASMYSNEEGDYRVLEENNVTEWEPETDVYDDDLFISTDSKICQKRLSMLTSGYETSMEADSTTCSKSLICVLQFTTNSYHDTKRKINDIDNNITPSSYDQVLSTLKECDSSTQIHIKLIRQILHNGPCSFEHNITLMNNLTIMEGRWSRMKEKCIICQLNLIETQMKNLGDYRDVEELKTSMHLLKEITAMFYDFKKKLNLNFEEKNKLLVNIDRIDEGLRSLKISKSKQLEIILQGVTCVTQSKCTRKLFGCELRLSNMEPSRCNVNVQEVYDSFEKCILPLKRCMESLDFISSTECRAQIFKSIEQEITLWQTLCERADYLTSLAAILPKEMEHLKGNHTFKNQLSNNASLFHHLPIHVSIVVVVAILGWWYNQSSTGDCRSSTDWIQWLYSFMDRLDPH